MTIQPGGSSGFVDQGVQIFDLSVDRVGLGVPAVPAAATVVAVDVKCWARSLASSGLEPDDRVLMAPSTRMRAGPLPCLSNAIVVLSFDLTLLITISVE